MVEGNPASVVFCNMCFIILLIALYIYIFIYTYMHRIRACGWIDISIFLSSCTDWLCTSTLLLGDCYRHHRVSIVSLLRLSRCLSLHHHHHRPNDRPNEERKKKRVIWSKSYKFFEFQTTTRRFFWKLRDSYYRRRRSSPLMSTTAPASLSTMSLETRQSKITITEVKSGGWRSTQR